MSEREKQTPEQWAVTLRRRFIRIIREAKRTLKFSDEERAAVVALAELIERGNKRIERETSKRHKSGGCVSKSLKGPAR